MKVCFIFALAVVCFGYTKTTVPDEYATYTKYERHPVGECVEAWVASTTEKWTFHCENGVASAFYYPKHQGTACEGKSIAMPQHPGFTLSCIGQNQVQTTEQVLGPEDPACKSHECHMVDDDGHLVYVHQHATEKYFEQLEQTATQFAAAEAYVSAERYGRKMTRYKSVELKNRRGLRSVKISDLDEDESSDFEEFSQQQEKDVGNIINKAQRWGVGLAIAGLTKDTWFSEGKCTMSSIWDKSKKAVGNIGNHIWNQVHGNLGKLIRAAICHAASVFAQVLVHPATTRLIPILHMAGKVLYAIEQMVCKKEYTKKLMEEIAETSERSLRGQIDPVIQMGQGTGCLGDFLTTVGRIYRGIYEINMGAVVAGITVQIGLGVGVQPNSIIVFGGNSLGIQSDLLSVGISYDTYAQGFADISTIDGWGIKYAAGVDLVDFGISAFHSRNCEEFEDAYDVNLKESNGLFKNIKQTLTKCSRMGEGLSFSIGPGLSPVSLSRTVGYNVYLWKCGGKGSACNVIAGSWGAWAECSVKCGGSGTRSRTCTAPAPQHGGPDCSGSATEVCDRSTVPCVGHVKGCCAHIHFDFPLRATSRIRWQKGGTEQDVWDYKDGSCPDNRISNLRGEDLNNVIRFIDGRKCSEYAQNIVKELACSIQKSVEARRTRAHCGLARKCHKGASAKMGPSHCVNNRCHCEVGYYAVNHARSSTCKKCPTGITAAWNPDFGESASSSAETVSVSSESSFF